MFERVIALEPDYAEAYRWLALGQCMGWLHYGGPKEPSHMLSLANARKAVALDPADAANHAFLGFVLMNDRLIEDAEAEFQAALRLNPNEADAWFYLSDLRVMEGRGADGVECSERSLRLNPRPPGSYFWLYGQALFAAGRYENAVNVLRREETYRTGFAPHLWPPPWPSWVAWMKPAKKAGCSCRPTRTSPFHIGWKPSRSATWRCGTGLLQHTALRDCRSEHGRLFRHIG